MAEILQVIAAGGDIGTWLILYVLWKQDKRITKNEWQLKQLKETQA